MLEVDHRTNLCNLITYTYTPFLVSFTLYGRIIRLSWWNSLYLSLFSVDSLWKSAKITCLPLKCICKYTCSMCVSVFVFCVCVVLLVCSITVFMYIWLHAHFSYKSMKENVMYNEFYIIYIYQYVLIWFRILRIFSVSIFPFSLSLSHLCFIYISFLLIEMSFSF